MDTLVKEDSTEIAQAFLALGDSLKKVALLLGATEEKKRKKHVKDPNHPKRAPNAYILFCGDHRSTVKAQNPHLNQKDIARRLGDMWNETSEEEKEDYKAKANKQRPDTAAPASSPALVEKRKSVENKTPAPAKKKKPSTTTEIFVRPVADKLAAEHDKEDDGTKKKKKKKNKQRKEQAKSVETSA